MSHLPRRPFRSAAAIACSLALGAGLILHSAVRAEPNPTAVATVDRWAQNIWTTASRGDTERALALLADVPLDGDSRAASLRDAIAQRNTHLANAEKTRDERLAAARTELTDFSEKGDLSESLRAAVEIYALSRDKSVVLADPLVAAAVTKAEAAAREAETTGDWLHAHELFYRLDLLFEEAGRFKPDLERLSHRLTMIRLYLPERLHTLRNEERLAAGEEALPPFNPIGEDWREKLADVDDRIVLRALQRASTAHVEDVDMTVLLRAGLRSMRTLALTSDLVEVFPALGDNAAVTKFLAELAEIDERLAKREGRAGYFDLTQTLTRLEEANARTIDLPKQVVWHEFGNGAMERLDPFSSIIWPDELRRFQRSTQGHFTGVGIQISLDDSLQLKVVTPLDGTPAQRAGIRPGDIIRSVDGESTLGISLNQAVDRITGPQGTRVTLGIEREGEEQPLEFSLVRDVIPVYSVKGWERSGPHEDDWNWFIDPANGIGYVRMTQFSETSTQEFDRAVREMKAKGLNALIFDLRFNPGGLLSEAVSVCNRWVDEGVIVTQQDGDGVVRESQNAVRGYASLKDIPTIVLVNEGAASASEIVSGCLQDYGKAVVLGARSYGKGSVQNVYDMGGGRAALKLTTQYYRLPKGRLIHRRDGETVWGVEPDIAVEMLPSQIGDSLTMRQDADLFVIEAPDADAVEDAEGAAKSTKPDRLLTEGVDTQLETALLLLRSQTLAREIRRAAAEGSRAPVRPAS